MVLKRSSSSISSIFFFDSALHFLLQNLTSSQDRSHFFLQANKRLQFLQTLVSRFNFLCKIKFNQLVEKTE